MRTTFLSKRYVDSWRVWECENNNILIHVCMSEYGWLTSTTAALRHSSPHLCELCVQHELPLCVFLLAFSYSSAENGHVSPCACVFVCERISVSVYGVGLAVSILCDGDESLSTRNSLKNISRALIPYWRGRSWNK